MIQRVWGIPLTGPRWTVDVVFQAAVLGMVCLSLHVMVKHACLLGFVILGSRVADQDMDTIVITSLCQGVVGALFLSMASPTSSVVRRVVLTALITALTSLAITLTRMAWAL